VRLVLLERISLLHTHDHCQILLSRHHDIYCEQNHK
jgi:hypothetical protein